jgi:hypothetical protein
MGVLYLVTPLVQFAEQANKPWLDAIGFTVPANAPTGRNPTAKEVRAVLESLSGYAITYHIDEWTWVANVVNVAKPDGPDWTTVHLSRFEGNESEPTSVFFAKGSEELIVKIVEQLSQFCGPLVVDNDISGAPLLVTPDIDSSAAIRQWWSISERTEKLTSKGDLHST